MEMLAEAIAQNGKIPLRTCSAFNNPDEMAAAEKLGSGHVSARRSQRVARQQARYVGRFAGGWTRPLGQYDALCHHHGRWMGWFRVPRPRAGRPGAAAAGSWKCQGCGDRGTTGVVHIQTQGKQDFLDEAGGDFDADRWPDAFGLVLARPRLCGLRQALSRPHLVRDPCRCHCLVDCCTRIGETRPHPGHPLASQTLAQTISIRDSPRRTRAPLDHCGWDSGCGGFIEHPGNSLRMKLQFHQREVLERRSAQANAQCKATQ